MLAAAASLVAALTLALPAQTVTIDEVGEALRSDPVYVDPNAERALTAGEADELRDAIRQAGTPVFVAVLPGSLAGSDAAAGALLEDIRDATRLSGTYAVVVGDHFRVGGPGNADAIATSAFQEARDEGAGAVLLTFVDRLSQEAGGGGVVDRRGGDGTAVNDDDGGGGSSLLPIALIGAGGVGLLALSRRRRRADDRVTKAEFDADVQMLRAELSVLSDDVMRLEPEVVTTPEARQDYEAATTRFRAASAALDYADEPVDLVRVERVVREAEYAMSRARAIVAGHEPPPPPDDLRRRGRHDEPALDVDEYGQPVYVGAGPFYGGSWFGGGGGLFSGLLLGSMLGGFGPFGWGGHHHVYGDGGGDGGFGGGGDWGGMGGGDWGGGGGDIGGGDW